MGVESLNSHFTGGKSKIYLFIILFFALFLRVATLNNHGVWIDETWVVTTPTFHYDTNDIYPKFFEYPQVKNLPDKYINVLKKIYDLGPTTQICFMLASDMHPPFYYIISYYWTRLFGESIYGIRSLSIVIGLFSVLVIFYGCRPLLGEKIALLSSWFMAISPMFIHYNQLARNFSLVSLLVMLSFYLLSKLYKSFKWKFAILYGVTLFLSIFTHYYAIFFVISQAAIISLLEFKGNKKFFRWILIYLIVAVCYMPWLPALYVQFFLRNPTTQSGLVSFSLTTLLNQFYSIGFFPSITEKYVSSFSVNCLKLLNFFTITCILLYVFIKTTKKTKKYFIIVVLWAAVPIFLVACISFFKPLYSVKSLLPVLPAVAILFAIGLTQIRNKKIFYLLVCFMSVTMVASQFFWPTYPGIESTEDTRGAVAFVSKLMQKSDIAVVQPGFYRDGLWYYMKRNYIEIYNDLELSKQISERHNSVWLFRYWDNGKPCPTIHGAKPETKFSFFGVSVYFWISNC